MSVDNSVDFPAPDAPITPKISPGYISRFILFKITLDP